MKQEDIAFIDENGQDTAFCNIQKSVRAALKRHHGLQKVIAAKVGLSERQFRHILSGNVHNADILEKASELILQEEVRIFKAQERTSRNIRNANNLKFNNMGFSVLLDRVEAVAAGLAIREDYDPTATHGLESTTLEGAEREAQEIQEANNFSICILQDSEGETIADYGTLVSELQ